MSNTIQVRKHDVFRALISDVLPYETPMIFSNHGFYRAQKLGLIKKLDFLFSRENVGPSVPYTICVNKPNGDKRELHIPHPAHQLAMANFIYDNSEIILSCCSVSNFSIRAPAGVTSYFKEYSGKAWRHFLNRDMEVDQDNPEADDADEKGFANSFFTYKSYTLLYKYFKSFEYLSIEKKFKIHGKLDISKCFPSIYTHSLAWAVKGKRFAKESKNADTFESRFDKLMMLINDGETHGIIVGPEFSRIFAEVILQRVDVEVEKELELNGYYNSKHYKVHRYVDDYYIYANDEALIDFIKRAFKSELMKFKLFTNESKDSLIHRPFITSLGIAKAQVENELSIFFRKLKIESQTNGVTLDLIRNPYLAAQNLINRVRLNVKLNDVSVESFSGLVFSVFREKISFYLSELVDLKESENDNTFRRQEIRYTNFIVFCLDFLFYIYCQNIRVRTSFLLSQVLVLVNDYCGLVGDIGKKKIEKKVRDESRILFSILESDDRSNIETINLLLSLNHLFPKASKLEDKIKKYFGNLVEFDYFDAICCMYLLCRKGKNPSLLKDILDSYKHAVSESVGPFKDSSLSCFLLDLITFPDQSIEEKKKDILRIFLERSMDKKISIQFVNKTFSLIKNHSCWFIDWNSELNLKELLVRKDSQDTYN